MWYETVVLHSSCWGSNTVLCRSAWGLATTFRDEGWPFLLGVGVGLSFLVLRLALWVGVGPSFSWVAVGFF